MARIEPVHVLYDPEGRLTVVDSRKRVWVFNNKISPGGWALLTELPDSPPSETKQKIAF